MAPSGHVRRVDIVFTDDACISKLSGRYRGYAAATDVLAFDYEDGSHFGEIAISLDAAKRQAKERGMKLEQEVLLLVLHGLLHLGGLRDETYRGWCAMRIHEFEAMMRVL